MAKNAAVSGLPHLSFEGTVFSGKGQGKQFVELPWVKTQIKQKLGFTPYPGTLNIRLTPQSAEKRKLLVDKEKFVVEPQAGYCPGALFRASVGDVECAVVVPLVPDYPADVLEVIAPIYLRGKLGLVDGCSVAVEVTF